MGMGMGRTAENQSYQNIGGPTPGELCTSTADGVRSILMLTCRSGSSGWKRS